MGRAALSELARVKALSQRIPMFLLKNIYSHIYEYKQVHMHTNPLRDDFFDISNPKEKRSCSSDHRYEPGRFS